MRRQSLTMIVAFAILASKPQAFGADAGNRFLAELLGRPLERQGESFACFSREYDDAHLSAHPQQQVAFVRALVAARAPATPSPMYQVTLAFRFRGRAETLTAVAECGGGKPPDSVRGGARCAGPGDAETRLALAGRQAVVMTIPGGADLWAPGPTDQRHDTVANPFGPDDKAFRLVRTDLKQCEDLAFERQKPLRPHEP